MKLGFKSLKRFEQKRSRTSPKPKGGPYSRQGRSIFQSGIQGTTVGVPRDMFFQQDWLNPHSTLFQDIVRGDKLFKPPTDLARLGTAGSPAALAKSSMH